MTTPRNWPTCGSWPGGCSAGRSAQRAEENSIWHLLAGHLGPGVAALPVASGTWPQYDQVNVQAGLDAWLAEPGRSHRIAGLTRFHHTVFGLADLAQPGRGRFDPGIGLGNVSTDMLAGPEADGAPGAAPALRVTDAHLSGALDELLDAGNQLTRVLLGAPGRAPLGTGAVPPEPGTRPPP